MTAPSRRRTPAGTLVLSFRLHVDADPVNRAASGCEIPVVVLGDTPGAGQVVEGETVRIAGCLAERRWRERDGLRRSRLELLAAHIGRPK